MKFSIIVPVHNSEKYLQRCVDSLLDQDVDIEIILSENSSSDNSYELCERLAEEHKNIICTSIGESGVSYARNAGLRLATGDIIGFCDSDDIYEPNVLPTLEKAFNEYPDADAVITGFFRCYSSGKKDAAVYPHKRICKADKAFSLAVNDSRVMGAVWNKFFRRAMLDGAEFDPELIFCEDMHFVTGILSKHPESRYLMLNIPTYNYVINEDSVTHTESKTFNSNNEANMITALKKIRARCQPRDTGDKAVRFCIARYSMDLIRTSNVDEDKKKILIGDINENLGVYIRGLYKYCFQSKYNFKTSVASCLWLIKNKRKLK